MNTAVARGTWEGQVVDGRFPLFEWLGGSEHSDVFCTEVAGRKAAIKLVQVDAAGIGQKISQWRVASKLSHPHILSILDAGKCAINGNQLLYVVMEYAEEDLSQVLPVRPLSTKETGEMLPPVLDALTYLHGKGFVHGGLKPSNILAAQNQLKISSDNVHSFAEATAGKSSSQIQTYDAPENASGKASPASDVWSLGMTMVAALGRPTPSVPASDGAAPDVDVSVPAPFRQIARECLRMAPAERCSLDQIRARLQATSTGSQAVQHSALPRRRSKWAIAAFVAALVLLLAFFAMNKLMRSNPHQTGTSKQEATGQAQVVPSASEPVPGPTNRIRPSVAEQNIPNVPLSARNTIQGKVKVAVRVSVDVAGNVSDATLISPGPSKYFGRLALESSRKWKFTPAENTSAWILRFRFGRSGTEVTPTLTP